MEVEQYKFEEVQKAQRAIREAQAAQQRQKYGMFTKVFLYAFALIFLVLSLVPIYMIISSSFKTDAQIFAIPPVFVFKPTLDNYRVALTGGTSQVHYVINSLVVSIVSTAIALIFGAMAAYGLARFEFKGKNDIAYWILSTRMAPPIAFIVPMFVLIKSVGLLDTWAALIIMYTGMNLSFAVWILRGFFLDIPPELEESALVDGYTRLQVFTKIALPLVKPALAAVAVFSLIFSWNEFLFALILTQSNAKTIPIGIQGFSSSMGINWGPFMAVAFIAILPILIFTFIMQRYLVRGLTFGAVK